MNQNLSQREMVIKIIEHAKEPISTLEILEKLEVLGYDMSNNHYPRHTIKKYVKNCPEIGKKTIDGMNYYWLKEEFE